MNATVERIGRNIGFVGTRFSGTDGVSLEASKWAKILWDHRHVSYWYGGKLDTNPDISMLVPHANFNNPDIVWINERVFGHSTREPEVTRRIYDLSNHLKQTLYDFVRRFDLDILIVQNASCIPMNIPLGIGNRHVHRRDRISHDRASPRFLLGTGSVFVQCRGRYPGDGVPAQVAVDPARHDQLHGPADAFAPLRLLIDSRARTSWISKIRRICSTTSSASRFARFGTGG